MRKAQRTFITAGCATFAHDFDLRLKPFIGVAVFFGLAPWLGLLVSVALSASLCYAAVVNISPRDF